MKGSLGACALAFMVVGGCGNSETLEESERVQVLRRAAPSLPYTARIVVEGADEETRAKVGSLVNEALLASDALIGKCVTDTEARADVTIRIEMVGMPASGDLPDSTTSVGAAVLSSGLWLFGGVPGWFTRDRTFDPWSITMRVGPDVENPQLEDGTRAFRTDLNFVERADWPLYFVQILVPPAVLPASESQTKESLVEKFSEPLQMWVMDRVKLRWPINQLTRRDAMAQIQDDRLVIFSPATLTKAERDGVELQEEELQTAYVGPDAERLCLQRLRDTLVNIKFLDEQRQAQASAKTAEGPKSEARPEGTAADVMASGSPDEPARAQALPDPLVNLGVETLLAEYTTYSFALGGPNAVPLARSFRTTDVAGKSVSWTLRPPEIAAKPVD